MTVKITTETRSYVARPGDPNDEWDRGDTGQELTNVSAHFTDEEVDTDSVYHGSVFAVEPNGAGYVYAVIAIYSTGDTFGREDGQVAVMDVFSASKEAATVANELGGSYYVRGLMAEYEKV